MSYERGRVFFLCFFRQRVVDRTRTCNSNQEIGTRGKVEGGRVVYSCGSDAVEVSKGGVAIQRLETVPEKQRKHQQGQTESTGTMGGCYSSLISVRVAPLFFNPPPVPFFLRNRQ